MEHPNVRVYIDLIRCNGCGACSEVCPEVFGFDENTQRPLLKNPYPVADCVSSAVAYCPEDCIEVEEG